MTTNGKTQMNKKKCVGCGKEFIPKQYYFILCPDCWAIAEDDDSEWIGMSCNEIDDCGDR